jgi:hypothetical protein
MRVKSHAFFAFVRFRTSVGWYSLVPGRLTRAIRGTVVDASGGRVPESDISSFAHKSRTPEEQQTSMSMEREVGNRIAVGISYIFVHA